MRRAIACVLLTASAACAAEERTGPGAIKYDLTVIPGAEPRDLVIGLHGKGGKKETMAGWVEKLIPAAFKDSHRVWAQSNTDHWQRDAVPHLADLARRLKKELPVRHVIVFGFSAGGFAGSGCLFEHPDAFDAALIAGATWWGRPSSEEAKGRPIFWSVGDQDNVVGKNGGVENLRKGLEEVGLPPDRWRIDLLPGVAHTLDAPSLERGFAFLREQLAADDAVRPADEAALKSLGEAAQKGELGTVKAAFETLSPRRREVRRRTAEAIAPLLKSDDPERAALGLELAAKLGDPVLAGPLVKARGKAKKDEARSLALVRALGALEGGAGLAGLVDQLDGWEHEGKVQIAAAEQLGAMGHAGAIDPLIAALKASEKKKDRAAYAQALEAALRAITGAEGKTGAEAWLAWRKAK